MSLDPDQVRDRLAAALDAIGVREAWIVEVAARAAMVDEDGRITLPTYLGRRALDDGSAAEWLSHYCPASPPVDLVPDDTSDEEIGRFINRRAGRTPLAPSASVKAED